MSDDSVLIGEVGPRDGLQLVKHCLTLGERVEWITRMGQAGIRQIEVGSFVSPKLFPQFADTSALIAALPGNLRLAALAPNVRGADAAFATTVAALSVPLSGSEGHSRKNLNRSIADQVEELRGIVALRNERGSSTEVIATCSTCFGCSIDGIVLEADVIRLCEAVAAAGADGIVLCDTVGYAQPHQVRSIVRSARSAVGSLLRGLHFHDTFGMALANANAGAEEGVHYFESSLGGLGGCPYAPGASGNVATEDLVYMLESRGLATGIDLAALIEIRTWLQQHLPGERLDARVRRIPKTYPLAGRFAGPEDTLRNAPAA